jgi:hypothetical protein
MRPKMRRLNQLALACLQLAVVCALGAVVAGCHDRFPKGFDPDKKSGPDGKRSGAQVIKINKARTDEVSYANQDRTDWYVVTLKGQPNVLATEIHWDNAKSDLMVDVFDEFGKQISASPTRAPGSTQKTLLTQIEHLGVYYIRISAPKQDDGTVYTMEAKWDEPAEPVVIAEPPPKPEPKPEPVIKKKPPKEEPREKPALETIQGHIVSAYRESGQLTIHIDKGSAAGVKVGMAGTILSGPSGEDPLSGGAFRVVQVLDDRKSVARCALLTVGKNTRVAISVR